MKLYLRDRKAELVAAWKDFFRNESDVHVSQGDILDMRGEAIVSPANSFGFLDGGIDAAYTERFGPGVQQELQTRIETWHGGELLVGQANFILTKDKNIPYLIVAPTMRVPMDISGTVNVYLAFGAVLQIAKEMSTESILCPGMGTGIGKMPPVICAKQMYMAWKRFQNPKRFATIREAYRDHHSLVKQDYYDDFSLAD